MYHMSNALLSFIILITKYQYLNEGLILLGKEFTKHIILCMYIFHLQNLLSGERSGQI